MSNYLKSGAVLPFGLMSINSATLMAAFNKTYRNLPLRVGVIVASYSVNDPNNYSNLSTEYDVDVIEQNEDKSVTSIRYKNCLSAEGMGSIADYLEKNLRPQVTKLAPGATTLSGQDGAVVLLLCLDGMASKSVILGALTHPDRQTQLQNSEPFLAGEYNGVNIEIDNDGNLTLTIKGATDNEGIPLTPSASPTTVTITNVGEVTISAPTQSVNINCLNANVIAKDTAIVDGVNVKLGKNAVQSLVLGDLFQEFFNTHTHPTVFGPSGPPIEPMTPALLSQKSSTE